MAGAAVKLAGTEALHGNRAPGTQAPGGHALPRRGTGGWRSRMSSGTTPGRLRLMLALLVLGSLAWGALATFTAALHTSGAGDVVAASEPLTFDAQQIWRSLSDANDQAATAIVAGGLEPPAVRTRYDNDLKTADQAIEDAAARGAPKADLETLATGLTTYKEEVATALPYNRLGYPLGA